MSTRTEAILLIFVEVLKQKTELAALTAKVEQMAVEQTKVDEKFTALQTALTGIKGDVDALKASVKPGEPMTQTNFDRLSAIADAFAALDAENTTPAEPA